MIYSDLPLWRKVEASSGSKMLLIWAVLDVNVVS